MKKYIVLSFLFMGWAFYELSGGSEFESASDQLPEPAQVETDLAVAEQPVENTVSQSDIQPAAQSLAQVTQPATVPAAEITLASVPTTRLVGAPQPTPKAEMAKLGPSETDVKPNDQVFSLTATKTEIDFRSVIGSRVNMRNGPSTDYSVVSTLLKDTQVEILRDPGDGWVKLRVLDTGRVGWMAGRFLTEIN